VGKPGRVQKSLEDHKTGAEAAAVLLSSKPGADQFLLTVNSTAFWAFVLYHRGLTLVKASGGDNAAQLAKLNRQVEIWGILMLGSALVLAGAVIPLVRAF
jgi:hypothetical protein